MGSNRGNTMIRIQYALFAVAALVTALVLSGCATTP
jgi:hypothetical protein